LCAHPTRLAGAGCSRLAARSAKRLQSPPSIMRAQASPTMS
jgi:hypothetical protein